jgi:hypothetical protein
MANQIQQTTQVSPLAELAEDFEETATGLRRARRKACSHREAAANRQRAKIFSEAAEKAREIASQQEGDALAALAEWADEQAAVAEAERREAGRKTRPSGAMYAMETVAEKAREKAEAQEVSDV